MKLYHDDPLAGHFGVNRTALWCAERDNFGLRFCVHKSILGRVLLLLQGKMETIDSISPTSQRIAVDNRQRRAIPCH